MDAISRGAEILGGGIFLSGAALVTFNWWLWRKTK